MTGDQTLHDLRTRGELRATAYVDLVMGEYRAFLEADRTTYYVRVAGLLWDILPPGQVPAVLREMAAAVRAVRWPAG